jgi:hypothetical protein
LKENAVGYNTMRKTYIDGKEDVIQYAFRNGQIVKKAATGDALGEDIYDVELFKKGLNNMMAGGFTVLIPPLPKNPKQTKDWKLSIRFTVISWEAQPRKARCISCCRST